MTTTAAGSVPSIPFRPQSMRARQIARMGLQLPPAAQQRRREAMQSAKRKMAQRAEMLPPLPPAHNRTLAEVLETGADDAAPQCMEQQAYCPPPLPPPVTIAPPAPAPPQPPRAKPRRLVQDLWNHSPDAFVTGALEAVRTGEGFSGTADVRRTVTYSPSVLHQALLFSVAVANQDATTSMLPAHQTYQQYAPHAFNIPAIVSVLCTWRAVCWPFANCLHTRLEAVLLLGPASFQGTHCLDNLTVGDVERARLVIGRWQNIEQINHEWVRAGFVAYIQKHELDAPDGHVYKSLTAVFATTTPHAHAHAQRQRCTWWPLPYEVVLMAWSLSRAATDDQFDRVLSMPLYGGYCCVHNSSENRTLIVCIAIVLMGQLLKRLEKNIAASIANHAAASALGSVYHEHLPQAVQTRQEKRTGRKVHHHPVDCVDVQGQALARAVSAAGVSMTWLHTFFWATDIMDILIVRRMPCVRLAAFFSKTHTTPESNGGSGGGALTLRDSIAGGNGPVGSGGGGSTKTSMGLRTGAQQLVRAVMEILAGPASTTGARQAEVAAAFATSTCIAPCVAAVVVRACTHTEAKLDPAHQFKYHVRWFLMEQLRCAGWTLSQARTLLEFLYRSSKGASYAVVEDFTWLWNRTQFLEGSSCKAVWTGDKAIPGVCPFERENGNARRAVMGPRLAPRRDCSGVGDIEDMLERYDQVYDQHVGDAMARGSNGGGGGGPALAVGDAHMRVRWRMCKDCLHVCRASEGDDSGVQYVRPAAWARAHKKKEG